MRLGQFLKYFDVFLLSTQRSRSTHSVVILNRLDPEPQNLTLGLFIQTKNLQESLVSIVGEILVRLFWVVVFPIQSWSRVTINLDTVLETSSLASNIDHV